jgi:hypothetical protein
MALVVATARPHALLRRIREAITEELITTWTCDSDGDFTHASEQWRRRLWLRPIAGDGELVLRTVAPENRRITTVEYAYYHGHFAQMLLTHFDEDFDDVTATAHPDRGDRLGRR